MTKTSRKTSPRRWGLLAGAKPPDRLPLSELATRNVYLSGSQYGAKYDLSVIPAHAFILDEFKNPHVKEIANVAVTGFGKTTIFEVCASYAVAQDPGDMLILGQNDRLIQDWMESRMLKVLRRSPWTKDFIPSGRERHDAKKTQIIFPHMAMFTGGANEANTQEKSMRYVFGDEIWKWKHGMIGESLRRHHNRLNRKMLLQSQGGDEGTEWHEFCRNGKWHDGHHQCPECKEWHPVKMDMLRFEKIRDVNDEYDWPRINETIRLVCPGCQAEFADTDQNRRQWSKVKPVWNGNKHLPGRVTFSWTFLSVWTKSWAEIVALWILANDRKKQGDLEPLRAFINKELGQFWSAPVDTPALDLSGDAYTKTQHHEGEPWEGETDRDMTIDVQKGHFWARIRAWKRNGEGSRLLWEGRVDTWQTLFYLQEKFGIENPDVYIDGNYEIDEIVRQIYKHCGSDPAGHWKILRGEDSNGYRYNVGNPKKPRMVTKIYSKYQHGSTSCGLRFRRIHYSNLRAKDALSGIMRIGGGNFGVPVDASKEYKAHMQSEIKREYAPGKWRWEKVKPHFQNHLWDCETMGIVAASIKGILRIESESDS
jgi:phage terminase large subunit GpA-like protein